MHFKKATYLRFKCKKVSHFIFFSQCKGVGILKKKMFHIVSAFHLNRFVETMCIKFEKCNRSIFTIDHRLSDTSVCGTF